jgi:WD40 repeat protein
MSMTRWLGGLTALLLAAQMVQAQVLERRHVIKAFDKPVNQVAVSADGKTVAAARNHVDTKNGQRWTEFRVWDARTHKELASWRGHTDDSAALALSPGGDLLASRTLQGQALLRSVKGQRERTYGRLEGLAGALRFSDDGSRLGAASEKTIMLVRVPGDKPKTVKYRGRHSVLAFSPDLRFLACACHQDVDLFDTATGRLHTTLSDHPGSVGFIAFSGDGRTVAAIATTFDENGYGSQVLVWDLPKRSVRARLKSLGWCTSLGVSNNGAFLLLMTDKALRAYAHELKAIDVSSGKTTSSIRFDRSQTPSCQAFSRDGKLVAVGCHDGSVQLFDVK